MNGCMDQSLIWWRLPATMHVLYTYIQPLWLPGCKWQKVTHICKLMASQLFRPRDEELSQKAKSYLPVPDKQMNLLQNEMQEMQRRQRRSTRDIETESEK